MKNILIKSFVFAIGFISLSSSVFASSIEYEPQKSEFRAAWVASVANIDWPSKKGLTIEEQKNEFIKIADSAREMKLNALIMQIRPTADAFYKSELNPWSEYLTGIEGVDPGYDPLEFMIEEAHKRNLEFHAWFNPFRVFNGNKDKTWSAKNIKNTHPEWIVEYEGKLYINPGIDEARKFVVDSILEVVKNYDIDAIHFDDYFYPYPSKNSFPDLVTYKNNNKGFIYQYDWRRDNINQFIKDVSEKIKEEKSYIRLGVSPFGVWRNKKDDPTGSETAAGTGSYDGLYADTRLWVNNNWIDYIIPQIYWEFEHKTAAYGKVLDFWTKEVSNSPNVHLYIGHASYKIPDWKDATELQKQIKHNTNFLEVKGSAFYNISSLIKNHFGFKDDLIINYYKYEALIPPTKNIDDSLPNKVDIMTKAMEKNNVHLIFKSEDKDLKGFVVYKTEGIAVPDTLKPENIVEILRFDNNSIHNFYDRDVQAGKTYSYVITALDRRNNESEISEITTFTID